MWPNDTCPDSPSKILMPTPTRMFIATMARTKLKYPSTLDAMTAPPTVASAMARYATRISKTKIPKFFSGDGVAVSILSVNGSDFLDAGAAEQAVGHKEQGCDDHAERDDLCICGAQERRRQRFDQAVQQTGDHHAPSAGDTA